MGEKKRFIQSKYAHHLQDIKTNTHYYLTPEKIGCEDLFDEIERLTEENEQLRHEIEIEKKWQLAQDRYYVKIKEENEQLRKELDNFKPIMFKNMQKGTIILYSKGGIDE